MPKWKNINNLYLFFASFIILFILNLMVPIGVAKIPSYTTRMWLLFQIYVMIFALFILITEKLPSKNIIIVSLVLGVLTGLHDPGLNIGTIITITCTILTFMASSRIFQKSEDKIAIFANFSKMEILKSIIIGIVVGLILAAFNFFVSGNLPTNFNMNIQYFLVALNPGIFEEVSFRFFMFAFSIYLLKGKANTKKEKIWCYIVMILPHVLIHTPDLFFRNGVIYLDGSILVTIVVFSLLFGLPFALLQRKRDLSSAMIAHGLVDFIRFCFLGLPI